MKTWHSGPQRSEWRRAVKTVPESTVILPLACRQAYFANGVNLPCAALFELGGITQELLARFAAS